MSTINVSRAQPNQTPHTFTAHNDPEPRSPVEAVKHMPPSVLTAALDDKRNLSSLAEKLNEIANRLGTDASPEAVGQALASTTLQARPESSITLEAFIQGNGLGLPTCHFHLVSLADAVGDRALQHPLGSLGGALSWPMPMSPEQQRRLLDITRRHVHHLGDQRLVMQSKGVLDFLNYRKPLSTAELEDPLRTLNALLSSAEARVMEQSLQARMGGIAGEEGTLDYVLAAIAVQMDHESQGLPQRNSVAGFDLAQPAHWGKPLSTVVARLAAHLADSGKTTAALANAGAYLLLARRAPEYLIKDMPANITYGSPAWLSLRVAVAVIEAAAPGTVPGMTFVQIMQRAKAAAMNHPAAAEQAQKAALVDWGVANGLIDKKDDALYTGTQLNDLGTRFNQQLSELNSASQALDQDIPTRKEIALAKLIARFGDLGDLFEEKLIHTHDYAGPGHRTSLVGDHSLLDIAMMDLPSPAPFVCRDARVPIDKLNANPRFGVTEDFNQAFNAVISQKKTASATAVRHLIAQLPMEDRRNLEFGKLTFFQETSFTRGLDFTSTTPGPTTAQLWVKAEHNGVTTAYEIDLRRGTLERVGVFQVREHRTNTANKVEQTRVFRPGGSSPELSVGRSASESPWDSFSSVRSRDIADVFVKHLDLDKPDIKRQARGKTTLDLQTDRAKPVEEFLLNLIPLRSAIVNFQRGNYGEGATDLMLDIFGFLTAGIATAAKVAKVGAAAVSGATRLMRGAKVIGSATISAFNPLGGLGDLSVGSATFLRTYGGHAINRLRGATGSYDLLKAVSKHYDAAAAGALKIGDKTGEGGAILKGGHWYAFDAEKMRPYGSPLEAFEPGAQAVDGTIDSVRQHALNSKMFGHLAAPQASIEGLTRNSQGVYVAADGHQSFIRHIDDSGKPTVYEVRQVTRGEDGVVQARVYHNNRQSELLVQHVQGDQWQRLGAPGGVLIEAEHLRAWEALPRQEQQRLTVQGFARQRRLHAPTLAHYVQPDGQLSAAGVVVRNRAAGTPHTVLTANHIRDWQGMTQQARNAMTMEGFAGRHHLNATTFKNAVRQDGNLGPNGEALLFKAAGGIYSPITDEHLLKWSQRTNGQPTLGEFLRQHRINPCDWRQYVFIDGTFNSQGSRRLSQAQQSAAMSPAASRKRPAPDPLNPPQQAPLDLSKPASSAPNVQVPGPSLAVPPLIKVEPAVPPLRTLPAHQIDNTLPILQDPANPRLSLTQAIEGPIDDIRIANWHGLLDGLEPAEKAQVSARIKESIKDWLRSEGNHGPRFDQTLEVMTALDDGGPSRGASVWARRDIAQFEVLGPYSGKYHESDASLFQEQRKQGSRAVLTYLFGTRSGNRSISALNSGNTLSLVNTSQLPNGPVWKANNVMSIAVGKNLAFYVALKDIKKGDELLLDYGPLYETVPATAIKPDPDA